MNARYKILNILFVALMGIGLSSCEEDYFGKNKVDDGVGVKMQITANIAFSGVESRAVYESGDNFTADDVQIDNYCFLLFNNSKRLVRAFDLAPNELPYYFYLPAPGIKESAYYAYLLGNTTLKTLFQDELDSGKYTFENEDGEIETADELSELYGQISIDVLRKKCNDDVITRLYNNPEDNDKNKFTWSGYLPVTNETKILNFQLNPNVAKLTATVKNNSTSGSKVMSVRLKNVANKVGYAQNAINKSNNSSADRNDIEGLGFLKYDMEYLEIAQGSSKIISWYVPQNKQGIGNREDNAPQNATYLEIDGVKMPNYITSAYRVYPGANPDDKPYTEIDNFNISADTIYNMTININDDGISTEVVSGVSNYQSAIDLATAKVKLPPNSNCYMIHPIGDRIVDNNGKYATVYELPIDRVNQYWRDVVKNDASRILDAKSEWTVEVIWQDINTRAIHFCDEYGVGELDTYKGYGLNPFCFKLKNDAMNSDQQTYGNVLVGLKKAGVDGYLWSWHLWITDYNPDAAPKHGANTSNLLYFASDNPSSIGAVDRQGVKFAVPSTDNWTNTSNVSIAYSSKQYVGNVQHYNSKFAPYWTNSGRTESSALWDGSGIYANKWIMDRNIGAQSPNNSEIENPLDGWGMYYQFGRKDPFIFNYTYDINGNKRSSYSYSDNLVARQHWKTNQKENGTSVSGSIENGVKYPTTYFTADGSWATNSTKNDWFSPTAPKSKGAKTLFDPCPPGWRVPLLNVFKFGEYGFPNSGFEEYARTFADDLNTSDWKHASVCAYVNVNGTYKDPKNYAGNTQGKIDYRHISNDYNNSITSYGDKFRNFAVLYSTDLVNGSKKVLKAHFPLQGHINGNDGTIAKIFHANGITPIQQSQTGVVWKNYVCAVYNKEGALYSGSGLQARLWSVEYGTTSSSTVGGKLVNILTATLDNNVNPRQEQRNGRLYLRFHGTMRANNIWNASNGFNVRCIQE